MGGHCSCYVQTFCLKHLLFFFALDPLQNHEPTPPPPFSLASNEFLNLPSIFSLMPYMHLSPESSLNPIFRIAPKASHTVRFVFGIPTVKRTIESYLIPTLQNLIRSMSPAEQTQACFVVLVAEVGLCVCCLVRMQFYTLVCTLTDGH